MRIRRSAARLLGSAYSAPEASLPDATAPSVLLTTPLPPPTSCPEPCLAFESRAMGTLTSPDSASGVACELSRSPWDLIAELSISDPQVEDDLVDKFFVSVTCRASWLFTASMPVASVMEKEAVAGGRTTSCQPRQEVRKKVPNKLAPVSKEKESEPKKVVKVKKEEDQQELKQPTYKCKKNDGRRWHCRRPVSSPNSLCDYHSHQKRAYLKPEFDASVAAEVEAEVPVPQPACSKSKPATTSKTRKKKPRHDFSASEGFYYYAGFSPWRSKRQGKSNSVNENVPPKEEEEEEELAEDGSPTSKQAQAAADDTIQLAAGRGDKSNCDIIAGVEESSDDDQYEFGSSVCHMNGSGERRIGNFDGKRNNGRKRWRKPVKERSLKSLM